MDDELLALDRIDFSPSDCECTNVGLMDAAPDADAPGPPAEAAEPRAQAKTAEVCGDVAVAASAAPEDAAELSGGESAGAELTNPQLSDEPQGAEESTAGPVRRRGPSPAQIIEALLFSSDSALSLNRLAELAGCRPLEVRLHMADLNAKYQQCGLTFRIESIARGYQMLSLPDYGAWIEQLNKQKSLTRLSAAALETLSIVAYKQPVIRADIESIRGVASGEVLNRLREMGLVKVVGRAEVVGRPLLYATTKKFLDIFGLADIEDLPPMEALSLRRALQPGEGAGGGKTAEEEGSPPRLAAIA